MALVDESARELGVKATCTALGVPRASYYRARGPRPERKPRPRPARALSTEERSEVLAALHEPRFVDVAPAEIYARLLDEGTYLCSERTFYRILADESEVRERRAQRIHPRYAAPELLATGPNQLWSWDITRLLGPRKLTYYYLYVLLDIFSRYVVGWLLAETESAEFGKQLIETSCQRQGILPGQLTVHSDRGAPMTSKTMKQLLEDLDATRSFSRPRVSNDNPFSESQFKTLKYRPEFPDRFASMVEAQELCRILIPWYNEVHRHVGLGLFTPHDVHYGLAGAKWEGRDRVLAEAFGRNPERFPHGRPEPRRVPTAVWINPPSAPKEPIAPPCPGSGEVEIVDPGASCEVGSRVEILEIRRSVVQELSLAVVQ